MQQVICSIRMELYKHEAEMYKEILDYIMFSANVRFWQNPYYSMQFKNFWDIIERGVNNVT